MEPFPTTVSDFRTRKSLDTTEEIPVILAEVSRTDECRCTKQKLQDLFKTLNELATRCFDRISLYDSAISFTDVSDIHRRLFFMAYECKKCSGTLLKDSRKLSIHKRQNRNNRKRKLRYCLLRKDKEKRMKISSYTVYTVEDDAVENNVVDAVEDHAVDTVDVVEDHAVDAVENVLGVNVVEDNAVDAVDVVEDHAVDSVEDQAVDVVEDHAVDAVEDHAVDAVENVLGVNVVEDNAVKDHAVDAVEDHAVDAVEDHAVDAVEDHVVGAVENVLGVNVVEDHAVDAFENALGFDSAKILTLSDFLNDIEDEPMNEDRLFTECADDVEDAPNWVAIKKNISSFSNFTKDVSVDDALRIEDALPDDLFASIDSRGNNSDQIIDNAYFQNSSIATPIGVVISSAISSVNSSVANMENSLNLITSEDSDLNTAIRSILPSTETDTRTTDFFDIQNYHELRNAECNDSIYRSRCSDVQYFTTDRLWGRFVMFDTHDPLSHMRTSGQNVRNIVPSSIASLSESYEYSSFQSNESVLNFTICTFAEGKLQLLQNNGRKKLIKTPVYLQSAMFEEFKNVHDLFLFNVCFGKKGQISLIEYDNSIAHTDILRRVEKIFANFYNICPWFSSKCIKLNDCFDENVKRDKSHILLLNEEFYYVPTLFEKLKFGLADVTRLSNGHYEIILVTKRKDLSVFPCKAVTVFELPEQKIKNFKIDIAPGQKATLLKKKNDWRSIRYGAKINFTNATYRDGCFDLINCEFVEFCRATLKTICSIDTYFLDS